VTLRDHLGADENVGLVFLEPVENVFHSPSPGGDVAIDPVDLRLGERGEQDFRDTLGPVTLKAKIVAPAG
jgi:hypothetical protein